MRQIGNYTVEDEPMARGGMGQIFRGRDKYGHVVAVKEILPEFATDMSILARIEKEVEFLAKIDHPSIVKLYAAFRDPKSQCYYIVMELVEGLNIEQYVMRNGPIPPEKAVDLMLKILDAVQCVHNAHIVHRDIKPSNIMIRPNGNVCLLDFGVAKDMDHGGLTVAGSIIGTSGYMSPEQAAGYSINNSSDIYSLGCVFFYMLTGHHAFNTLTSDFETKDAIINNEFPRLSKYNPNLPPVLQQILDKATDKNMMRRYQSCYEFMSALSNGTHVSHTGSTNMPVMLTVGRENCDITVNDSQHKVSRHHADIELKEFTGGKYYVFTDHSSNGTIVNGKPVRGSSVSIPADGNLPEIYLAGVADGHLDWNKVKAELNKRAKALEDTEDKNPSNINENVSVKKDNITKDLDEKSEIKQHQETVDYTPENGVGKLIVAFCLIFFGEFIMNSFGIFIADDIRKATVKLKDGVDYYRYADTTRTVALVASILGIVKAISLVIYIIVLIVSLSHVS